MPLKLFIFGQVNALHGNWLMANCYWRASEASETLSGVYKLELVRYIYVLQTNSGQSNPKLKQI